MGKHRLPEFELHVFRWDLDRTYLDTEIDSVRGLLRTAFQSATSKRTLPGASSLLRALQQHNKASKTFVLSGSPTQLRKVLEEKLAIDGIKFDGLVLKDSLGHIRKGRLKAIRGQVGYKLPQLLRDRVGLGPSVKETLFGDDSEADAVIYAAYAEAISGRLSPDDLARVLTAGGAYPEAIAAARTALTAVGPSDAVEDVFIRLDRRSPLQRFACLSHTVTPVYSWAQAAVVLHARGRLDDTGLSSVIGACQQQEGLDDIGLMGLLQDVGRRGLVPVEQLQAVCELPGLEPIAPLLAPSLEAHGLVEPPRRGRPDLVGFLRQH